MSSYPYLEIHLDDSWRQRFPRQCNLLTLLYVGMGAILPCLLRVLTLLDRVAVRFTLVAGQGDLGLVQYLRHGAKWLGSLCRMSECISIYIFVSASLVIMLRTSPWHSGKAKPCLPRLIWLVLFWIIPCQILTYGTLIMSPGALEFACELELSTERANWAFITQTRWTLTVVLSRMIISLLVLAQLATYDWPAGIAICVLLVNSDVNLKSLLCDNGTIYDLLHSIGFAITWPDAGFTPSAKVN